MTVSPLAEPARTPQERQYILTLGCPDSTGIVAHLSGFLSDIGAWITEAHFFSDPESGWFFTRQAVRADALAMSLEELEKAFAEIVDAHDPDAVVLARFMQILPPDLCETWAGRAINIHHSFLPSFMGARPYHQAHRRGVKLIGATCHYATQDLDDGPIIEQDVIRVSHKDTPRDMQREGRDAEKQVLARGLRWHLEDRVQVYGNRTVVFD